MAKNKNILVYLLLNISCFFSFSCSGQIREKIQKTYTSLIGIREKTGKNDGVEVEMFLNYVWLAKGNPWCAATVSWTLGQNGITKGRSGGCVQLMEQGKTIYQNGNIKETPQVADVFFIYFANKGRVAHTGFVDNWSDSYVTTVEGNTNEAGSREGDGVYRKRRLKRQIYAVSKFVP